MHPACGSGSPAFPKCSHPLIFSALLPHCARCISPSASSQLLASLVLSQFPGIFISFLSSHQIWLTHSKLLLFVLWSSPPPKILVLPFPQVTMSCFKNPWGYTQLSGCGRPTIHDLQFLLEISLQPPHFPWKLFQTFTTSLKLCPLHHLIPR